MRALVERTSCWSLHMMDPTVPTEQSLPWTNRVSKPNGPLHHSTAIGSKSGVGFPCVCPPHLTINTAQKQTACACVCDEEASAAGKMVVPLLSPKAGGQTLFQILCWLRQVLLCYWPLGADWAIGKLCKQINSREGSLAEGGVQGSLCNRSWRRRSFICLAGVLLLTKHQECQAGKPVRDERP